MRLRLVAGKFAVPFLAAALALTFAPGASALDGDPIASGTIDLKRSAAFKRQLAANGIRMKPKALWLRKGEVDPITGAADLRLGKVTFKRGKEKVVYGNLRATLGRKGKIRSSKGKLFKLSGGTVVRTGFGATITGVRVKLLRSAARKLNRKLGQHSLHRGSAGAVSVSYLPRTVKVVGGTAIVWESLVGGSVGFKLFSHCVSAAPPGVSAVAPATATTAIPPTFTLPISGGSISPAGIEGVLQVEGGLRFTKNDGGYTPGSCTSLPPASLEQTDFTFDLQQLNVLANRNITVAPPNVVGGDRGIAVGHSIDPHFVTVRANPEARTISYTDALIRINSASAGLLNEVFPNAGNPANNFAEGDPFGTADLFLNVR